jgi:hypothetical protein
LRDRCCNRLCLSADQDVRNYVQYRLTFRVNPVTFPKRELRRFDPSYIMRVIQSH